MQYMKSTFAEEVEREKQRTGGVRRHQAARGHARPRRGRRAAAWPRNAGPHPSPRVPDAVPPRPRWWPGAALPKLTAGARPARSPREDEGTLLVDGSEAARLASSAAHDEDRAPTRRAPSRRTDSGAPSGGAGGRDRCRRGRRPLGLAGRRDHASAARPGVPPPCRRPRPTCTPAPPRSACPRVPAPVRGRSPGVPVPGPSARPSPSLAPVAEVPPEADRAESGGGLASPAAASPVARLPLRLARPRRHRLAPGGDGGAGPRRRARCRPSGSPGLALGGAAVHRRRGRGDRRLGAWSAATGRRTGGADVSPPEAAAGCGSPSPAPTWACPTHWPVVQPAPSGKVEILASAPTASSLRWWRPPWVAGTRPPRCWSRCSARRPSRASRCLPEPDDAEVRLDGQVVKRSGSHGSFVERLVRRRGARSQVRARGLPVHRDEGERAQRGGAGASCGRRWSRWSSPSLVSSTPAGAVVFSGERMLGVTPLATRVPATASALTFRKRCFETAQVPLRLPEQPGPRVPVRAALRKVPGCR